MKYHTLLFSTYSMRYYYEKPDLYLSKYGSLYDCDHPVYTTCTLFMIKDRGLSVIQQRYIVSSKTTYWSSIDPWLNDSLYLHERFKEYFDSRAKRARNGLYPTVTIRQLMWALKMKPLPKERWETVFDRKDI